MKSTYEQILDKYGLTEADLDSPGHAGERETLVAWANQLSKGDLSMSQVRENVETMRYEVELELINEPEFNTVFFGLIKVPNRKCILLKARLHNYLVLEAFLAGPGKQRKAVERAINNMAVKAKSNKL